jgi:hypothetical protein
MTNAVQKQNDAQIGFDGAGAAIVVSEPGMATPRPPIRGRKTARRTTASTQPMRGSSAVQFEGPQKTVTQQGSALDGPAKVLTSPIEDVPGRPSKRNGHMRFGTQPDCAVAGDDHRSLETHSVNVIATITELWRRRQSWHRAEKSLTLAAGAICRRYTSGDKLEARAMLSALEKGEPVDENIALSCGCLLASRDSIAQNRKALEKQLEKLAKTLPIWESVKDTRGLGPLSLAGIVGECGDVGSYKSPAAVWKRMGLAVIGGQRQRRVAGADAIEHGFSPSRAAVSFVIGSGLVGMMGHGPRPRVDEDISARDDLSPYQKLFIDRLRFEAGKEVEHRRPDTERKGEVFESYSKHAANRARRYVMKRFLRGLWAAWRGCGHKSPDTHTRGAAPPPQSPH